MGSVIQFPKSKPIIEGALKVPAPGADNDVDVRLKVIPIVAQALFFLHHASLGKGIKLTEKGQLGRSFVQAFWDHFVKGMGEIFRPTREFECPEVTRIHSILTAAKYVRKMKGHIELTPKGRRAIELGAQPDLYRELLDADIFSWNWGFEDRYPDFDFIQGSATNLIAELWRWPSFNVTAAELFHAVFEHQVPGPTQPNAGDDESELPSLDLESDEWVVRCFHIRFLRRFCVPYGLLEAPTPSDMTSKTDEIFTKTQFLISDFPEILRKS